MEKEKVEALHNIEHVHNMTGLIKLFFRYKKKNRLFLYKTSEELRVKPYFSGSCQHH